MLDFPSSRLRSPPVVFPCPDRARRPTGDARYRELGLRLAAAESCTGGLVCGLLTEIPGSSAVVERGFVIYSNQAKQEMLGVAEATLARCGAVSEGTAWAMAQGALANSSADVAVAVTGIAGPDGGTAQKPVGLVHFALARRGRRDDRGGAALSGRSGARRCASPQSRPRSNCWKARRDQAAGRP